MREQGNLVRELRKLLKRVLKLALAECLRSGGNMGRLFKQACGIGADVNAMGGGLAAQFLLNLGLDINNDRHRRPLSLYCRASYCRASGSLSQAASHPHKGTCPFLTNYKYSDFTILRQGRRIRGHSSIGQKLYAKASAAPDTRPVRKPDFRYPRQVSLYCYPPVQKL